MSIDLKGTLTVINDTEIVTGKNFKKRTCVLHTKEQYAQDLLIEFTQDNCSILEGYAIHDKVTISVNLRGRKWTNPQGDDKYFISLQAWRISLNQDKPDISGIIIDNYHIEEPSDLPF